MTISMEIQDELLMGVERSEDLLGDVGLLGSVAKLAEADAGLISGFFRMYKFRTVFQ